MWKRFRKEFIEFLKGKAFKLVLKKIFKTAAMGGVKGWIVGLVFDEIYDEELRPRIQVIFSRIGYRIEHKNGEIIVKKMDDARRDNNEDDYNSSVGDIFD